MPCKKFKGELPEQVLAVPRIPHAVLNRYVLRSACKIAPDSSRVALFLHQVFSSSPTLVLV